MSGWAPKRDLQQYIGNIVIYAFDPPFSQHSEGLAIVLCETYAASFLNGQLFLSGLLGVGLVFGMVNPKP